MLGFGGCVPIDKESVKVVAAMHYLRLREDEEVEKVRAKYHHKPSDIDHDHERSKAVGKVRDEFKRKEIALLRRAAGPLAKIIDG